MGQPVVYKHATGKREDLRLVLQSAERGREDEPVVVALELRPVVMPLGVAVLLSEPFVTD